MKSILAALRFFPLFIWEFLSANLSVALQILFTGTDRLNSRIISYDTETLTERQRLFLAQLITLTPGTVVCGRKEKEQFQIHALSNQSDEELIRNIQIKLERHVREIL
ncbi:MAG: hypothetical protein CMO81_12360 [Waddliaceae bacterium]|nr:hypothetical protein [Waddliaceae bacterium]